VIVRAHRHRRVTHVEIVRSYLVCLVPSRQRFQEEVGGKDCVGIALDALIAARNVLSASSSVGTFGSEGTSVGRGQTRGVFAPQSTPSNAARSAASAFSRRQACPPGAERQVFPDSSIALRATRLVGFRAWFTCRLLRCSTARSQPDDHDRGYEHVRLDSGEGTRYAMNPDAVEGRKRASIDLPIFQEMPPS
jgi:hypothetical protein